MRFKLEINVNSHGDSGIHTTGQLAGMLAQVAVALDQRYGSKGAIGTHIDRVLKFPSVQIDSAAGRYAVIDGSAWQPEPGRQYRSDDAQAALTAALADLRALENDDSIAWQDTSGTAAVNLRVLADMLDAGSRQAITTSFRGPTDTKDARIIARCEAKRISVPWDDNLDTGANHAAAALQLMDQLGWSERNDLVMGGTREGYVFVQVPKRSK